MIAYRPFITSAVAFTFVVVGVTGVIFKFFFKTHFLNEVHGWLGIAMVVAAGFHVVQNWKMLKSHLQKRKVYWLLLPMALSMLTIGWVQANEPPRAKPRQVMAALSAAHLRDAARAFNRDAQTIVTAMGRDGLQVDDASLTLEQIATSNHVRPDELLIYFLR